MSRIDDDDLTIRKNKSLSNFLQAQNYIESMHKQETNNSPSRVNAKIAGRTVTSINIPSLKPTQVFQGNFRTNEQERLHLDRVKSPNKSESYQYYSV